MNPSTGHIALWPLNGQNRKYDYIGSYLSVNQFLGPLNQFGLLKEIDDIAYASKHNIMGFLDKNKPNRIFFQFFPSCNAGFKDFDISLKLEEAKKKLSTNTFLFTSIGNMTILKLASTAHNLFALAVSGEKTYMCKIKFANGEYEQFVLKEAQLGKEALEGDEIELQVYYLSENESLIFLLNKANRTLQFASFKESKNATIQFRDFNDVVKSHYHPISFSVYSENNRLNIAILDKQESSQSLILLKQKTSKFFLTPFDQLKGQDIEVTNIAYYAIQAQFLHVKPQEKIRIQLMLLYAKDKVFSYDLETKKMNCILGEGEQNLYELVGRHAIVDLSAHSIQNLNFVLPIENCGLIFGDIKKSQMYLLASPETRRMFFEINRSYPSHNYNTDNS